MPTYNGEVFEYPHMGGNYTGKMVIGKPHGYGNIVFPSGKKYDGKWKFGKMHVGNMTWPNGERYVGKFKNGEYHGQGTEYWPRGAIRYVGGFKDGKYHGQGTYFGWNGEKYVGEFKDGKWGKGAYKGVCIGDGKTGKSAGSTINDKLKTFALSSLLVFVLIFLWTTAFFLFILLINEMRALSGGIGGIQYTINTIVASVDLTVILPILIFIFVLLYCLDDKSLIVALIKKSLLILPILIVVGVIVYYLYLFSMVILFILFCLLVAAIFCS